MNSPAPPPVALQEMAGIANIAPLTAHAAPIVKKKRARALPLATTLLGAAGVLAWRMASVETARRRRTRRTAWALGGLGLATIAVARWQMQRLFTPEPRYEVELRSGRFEVRRYSSVRVAETTVDGTWDEALDRGFRRLASFIFGANQSHQKLRMTTPVLGTGDGDRFKLSFVLPEAAPSPAPNDVRVSISDVPARRVAVLRFHGRYDAHTIEAHKKELVHELALNGLTPRGEASFAGYDPPTTLPLLRRNELWVELEAR